MKAVVFEHFGGSEVLRFAEVEEPHAGPGQVRLNVKAVGVNPVDSAVRRGLMQQILPVTLPAVPGFEAAGVVDEVGDGVTGISVGDEVLGHTITGAYAQYALSPAADVAAKPAGLGWEQAAALPIAVETSDRVLETLKVTGGETLLVNGAAGVAASVGVQLAIARGATVIGTASEANHDYLRSLGAIPITYGDGLADRVRAAAPQGIDAVFDAGHGALEVFVDLRGGTTDRIVTIADDHAHDLGITFSTGPRPHFGSALADFARLAANGRLSVRIDRSLTLADAAQAQDVSESGHPRGKLILLP